MAPKTKIVVFVVSLLVSAALAGVLIQREKSERVDHPAPSPAADALSARKATLRLKWVYDPGFAGEMVGVRAGFFRGHGLDLDLRPGGFENDPIKLVASESDTFGVAGADSFLLARSKGIPIVAFAGGYLESPVVFYVHADSDIRSPRDFVGKKVGYQAGQDTATMYEALIRSAHVDRRSIREIPVKYDFTPFLTKQVDVWPGYAATQSYILERERIPYRTLVPGESGIASLGTVYFTSERFAAEHPEVVQAFLEGLIKGWEFTYANYDAAIRMISSYDAKNLTADLVRFNLDKQRPFILPMGMRFCEYSLDRWSRLQRVLLEQGVLGQPVALEGAVRFEFLETHYRRR